MAQLGGTPILILKEGTERRKGREAQSGNIAAAKAVAESVRTTLGPKGMDKMIVDSMGDVTITNDGVTILKEMDIEHPAAKMMVEVAKTQDDEVGDGTTTAVIFAGELLKGAEELIEQEIHPTVIAKGYKMASEKSYEILNGLAKDISAEDEELLKKIAMTSLTGKGAGMASDTIAGLCVGAVKDIEEGGEVDLDNVSIEKKHGKGIEDSVLVNGMLIDKEVVHPGMPKRVNDAKIALIDSAFEIEKTEIDAKIQITTPEQMQAFLDEEDKMLKDMVNNITSTGVNVLFCQKGIDDLAQHYLAKEGVVAVRRVKKSDMEKLSRATGAKIITNAEGMMEEDLGEAGLVEERKIGDDKMLFVEKCKNPKSVSILLRGATEHVVDELERGANDALHVVAAAVEDGKFLPGGGAPETELSLRLREYASTVGGREQLAIESFAKALEVTPRTLAENAGIDPIDALVEIRSAHEKGNKSYGLDIYTGKAKDMLEEGVIEPLRVKTQAISAASEVANMILRIDDIIASKGGGEGGMPPGGMGGMPPGGMGGMY